ncbi:MAG TPA: DEAD/DEAH box helicase, partial [Myxococcota bacterium]|nr:DEAD/DEAH box helicase [Myxococcota bacterium]
MTMDVLAAARDFLEQDPDGDNGGVLAGLIQRASAGDAAANAELQDRFGAPLPNRRYESAPDLDQLWTDLDFKVVNPQGKAEMEDYFKRRTVRIPRCPDSGEVLKKVCKTVKATHRYQVPHSGDLKQGVPPTFRRAALWQYQGKPLTLKPQGQLENPPRSTNLQGDGLRRWPPSEFIVRHLKHRFYGLVADEVHEYNGKESAQSQMLSRLMGVTKKFIGLTGTLSNGSASSLWALMCRLAPDRMNALGYGPALGAKGLEQFTNTYGIIEKIITREPEDGKTTKKRESIRTQEKPGIMPWLQTDQLTAKGPLLAYSAFLELGDVGHLPPLEEEIVMVDPPADLLEGAAQIEDDIRVLFKDRSTWSLAKKAILQMLNILTVYTDRPYGWTPVYVDGELVTVPENLDPDRLYPKEEAYLNLIQRELGENRRVITYLHYVNFGIVERLLARLREVGVKADYMSALVAPTDRTDWFRKALKSGVQVVLCNPECVKTGLNLTEWNTIVFYQSGRNIITNCQAECRCLRIGAKRTVRLVYLAYDDTIQERTLSIMGLKKVALTAVQGRFSAEGL